ncbi:MAG: hypothetical protein IPO26_21765 [Saprospiraceae bacterium]|nr:hypothetical protein [Saprospiraceae bacterium]
MGQNWRYLELSSAFTVIMLLELLKIFLGLHVMELPCADFGEDVEMAARRRNVTDNSFYVYIGAHLVEIVWQMNLMPLALSKYG